MHKSRKRHKPGRTTRTTLGPPLGVYSFSCQCAQVDEAKNHLPLLSFPDKQLQYHRCSSECTLVVKVTSHWWLAKFRAAYLALNYYYSKYFHVFKVKNHYLLSTTENLPFRYYLFSRTCAPVARVKICFIIAYSFRHSYSWLSIHSLMRADGWSHKPLTVLFQPRHNSTLLLFQMAHALVIEVTTHFLQPKIPRVSTSVSSFQLAVRKLA